MAFVHVSLPLFVPFGLRARGVSVSDAVSAASKALSFRDVTLRARLVAVVAGGTLLACLARVRKRGRPADHPILGCYPVRGRGWLLISILSQEGLRVVEMIGGQQSIIAVDFDGTLAPIVDEPDAARTTDYTRGLLHALAARLPCAVISGWPRADVLKRIGSVPLVSAFGNHGLESSSEPPSAELRCRLDAWTRVLRRITTPGK